MKVENKVALVTGGASGIGKALCTTLLDKGAKLVAVLDVNKTLGIQIVEEFSKKYGKDRVMFGHCDVVNEEQLKKAFHDVYEVHRSLDIVVNNAGIFSRNHIKTIEVNLIGVINGVYAGIELMTKEKRTERGIIINTASVAGLRILPESTVSYTASKHGVVGLTKALTAREQEFITGDLRTAVICPDAVRTNILTSSAEFSPEEIKVIFDKCVPMSKVIDAFMLAIEDDELNGAVISVPYDGNISVLKD